YEQTNALFLGADVSASYRFPYGFEYALKASILRADDTKSEQNLPMIPSDRLENRLRYALPIHNDKISESFLQVEYNTVFKQSRYNEETDFAPAPPTYGLLNLSGGTKFNLGTQSIGLNVSVINLLNVSYKEYMNRFRYYAHDT